jgi:hypothetical protein
MDNAGNTEVTSLRIGISKDFSVVVDTDKTYYDRGDSVNISGTVTFADANPFTNANVTVCIDLRGFRRSYPTTTDENGEFNFTFQPFTSEAGVYKVKAEVWNVGLLKADETQFTIQGLYLAPPQATFNMVENSTQTINFILYNLGDTALTGINANVEDLDISDNVNAVIIDVPDEVSPHEQIELILQITAGVPVPDKAEFNINVTTDQMSNEVSELTINLFSPEPVMVVNPGHISVGLNQNQTKIETVTVSNIGYGFLRNLTLNQPNESWMRITSNTSIGDLAPSENISFDIHIHSYNVSFGAYHDTVNITSDNYNAAQVNLMVNITELTNGSLLFHVNDYFGRNVTANISIIDDITYHEYTTTTNSTGYAFVSELPTGRYIYEVSSYNETLSSQLGSVIVEPSITTRVNVTLPISFIDFEWNVTPTTIEDWYKVVLNMTFETDVPIPIIVAFPPYLEYDLQRGEIRHDTLTLTNLGLVSLTIFPLLQ